jgi:hypothetical protein
LNFTRHQEENAFTVEATLRNFKPIQPFCVRWDYPLMRRDDELDPAKLKKSKGGRAAEYTVAMLVECLGERKLTTSELQKLCAKDKRLARMSPATFKRILHQAKELNAMAKDEDNRWKAEGSNGSEGSKPSSEPSKPTQRIKRLISL